MCTWASLVCWLLRLCLVFSWGVLRSCQQYSEKSKSKEHKFLFIKCFTKNQCWLDTWIIFDDDRPRNHWQLTDIINVTVDRYTTDIWITGKNNGFPFLDILGYLWVFFKYPKISKNENPLFFPVNYTQLRCIYEISRETQLIVGCYIDWHNCRVFNRLSPNY